MKLHEIKEKVQPYERECKNGEHWTNVILYGRCTCTSKEDELTREYPEFVNYGRRITNSEPY